MKIGGALGQATELSKTLYKKGAESLKRSLNPKTGGMIGEQARIAKDVAEANPSINPANANKIDFGEIAGKVGLGKYEPGMAQGQGIGGGESAFTDMSRSQGLIDELNAQRVAAGEREFTPAQAAQLAEADTMKAAQMKLAPQEEFRTGQKSLVSALQAQSAGQGPSLAAMQMDDARQQNIATAMALGASQRGLGAGQGLRQIADQAQSANQMAARDAMRGRIAEQLAARQQLGGVLQGARGQDIGIASEQAGLEQQAAMANQAATNQFALQQGSFDQQTALANQQAELQAQAQQDALTQALNQQIGGLTMGQQSSLQDLERMKMMRDLDLERIKAGAYGANQQAIGQAIGGVAQGVASLIQGINYDTATRSTNGAKII